MLMCNLYNLLHWIDGAKHVAHMSHADQSCMFVEKLFVCFHVKLSVVVHRYYPYGNAPFGSLQLPRHNV